VDYKLTHWYHCLPTFILPFVFVTFLRKYALDDDQLRIFTSQSICGHFHIILIICEFCFNPPPQLRLSRHFLSPFPFLTLKYWSCVIAVKDLSTSYQSTVLSNRCVDHWDPKYRHDVFIYIQFFIYEIQKLRIYCGCFRSCRIPDPLRYRSRYNRRFG